MSYDNSTSAVFDEATVVAVLSGAGPGGSDLVAEEDREITIAETPEVRTYDEDGNLTSDGLWLYEWDGENRLIAMESQLHIPDEQKRRLHFAYDGQSRRVSKEVHHWDDGVSDYVLEREVHFLWADWRMLGEASGSSLSAGTFERSYVWGLDLSGSKEGAGTVGGLLWIEDHDAEEAHFVAYDGNPVFVGTSGSHVGQLRYPHTATLSASYDEARQRGDAYSPAEGKRTTRVGSAPKACPKGPDGRVPPGRTEGQYGPFGQVLEADGPYAATNRFRFSAKYEDHETGLNYYGFRYYDPETGRWPSRDPIEERGGLNLYGMVANNPVNGVDYLGLFRRSPVGEFIRRISSPENFDLYPDLFEPNPVYANIWQRTNIYTNSSLIFGDKPDRECDSVWIQDFDVVVEVHQLSSTYQAGSTTYIETTDATVRRTRFTCRRVVCTDSKLPTDEYELISRQTEPNRRLEYKVDRFDLVTIDLNELI